MRKKYFKNQGDIPRKQLEAVILKAIETSEPAEEVVGLLIMYLFTMVLFPLTNGSVPLHLFHYCDNLAALRNYSWADAVYTQLMKHIPLCATWCNVMEKGGNNPTEDTSSQEDEDDLYDDQKKKRSPSPILPGCSVALEVCISYNSHVLHL